MDKHAIVIADRDGVIQLWSTGAAVLFGYAAVDTIGKKLDLIVPEQFRAAHWTGFGRAMSGGIANGEGTFFDAPVLCGNGETKEFRGQFQLLRNESKQAIGAMAIFTSR